MEKQSPAEGVGEPRPLLRVYVAEDGRWTFCYVDPAAGVELHGNNTYQSAEAAAGAARRAYPGVAFEDGPAAEGDG